MRPQSAITPQQFDPGELRRGSAGAPSLVHRLEAHDVVGLVQDDVEQALRAAGDVAHAADTLEEDFLLDDIVSSDHQPSQVG